MIAPVTSNGGNGKEKNENIQKVPAGMHPAILTQIIDLGSQEFTWQGESKINPKILLSFEITDHKQAYYVGEEAKTAIVSWEGTFSMFKKANLRVFIEGLFGKMSDDKANKFEFGTTLLSTKAFANIQLAKSKKGTEYNSIASISPYPTSMPAPVGEQDLVYYEIGTNGFNSKEFVSLPQWIRNKILESEQAKTYIQGGGIVGEYKDFFSSENPEENTSGKTVNKPSFDEPKQEATFNGVGGSTDQNDDFEF